MDKNDLFKKMTKYKDHITTAREWDKYAKGKDIPSSITLIRKFGSWNNLKESLSLEKSYKQYTDNELLQIAQLYSSHFTTIKNWDYFSNKEGLPPAQIYINHFGSWSNVKNILKLKPSARKIKYTNEQIKRIITENHNYFESRTQWDEFAKEKKLPSYLTLVNYFSWSEIKKMAGKPLRYNYTEKELQQIAREHIEYFTTMKSWDDYARQHNLPLSTTYSRRFESWSKAKFRCLY